MGLFCDMTTIGWGLDFTNKNVWFGLLKIESNPCWVFISCFFLCKELVKLVVFLQDAKRACISWLTENVPS